MGVNVQVTISGHDLNGFVWQNVFCLEATDDNGSPQHILPATNDWVNTQLIPAMQAAMGQTNVIATIGSKFVKPSSSYTITKVVNVQGDRMVSVDNGAVAGRIAWYPLSGAYVGHQFITGVCQGDYANDFITDAYSALLDDVKDAFLSLAGTDGTTVFDFVIYNRKSGTVVSVTAGEVMLRVGVLSKRVRA